MQLPNQYLATATQLKYPPLGQTNESTNQSMGVSTGTSSGQSTGYNTSQSTGSSTAQSTGDSPGSSSGRKVAPPHTSHAWWRRRQYLTDPFASMNKQNQGADNRGGGVVITTLGNQTGGGGGGSGGGARRRGSSAHGGGSDPGTPYTGSITYHPTIPCPAPRRWFLPF
jgi:hypothetical protein